nr:SEL1-like repeat protein [Nitrosophilus labii]
MGLFYEEGISVEKSVQKAINFYKKAAQKGDLEAKIKLKILQKAKKISKKELKAKEIEDFQTVVNSLINRYDKKKRAVLKRKFSDKLGLYPYKENYFLPFAYDFDEKKEIETKKRLNFNLV